MLFREIEERGGKGAAIDRRKFSSTIAGEVVEFSVRERFKQERREATAEERRSSFHRDREYVTETWPTGTLKLELDPCLTTFAKMRWDDRIEQPLENQLASILAGLFMAAAESGAGASNGRRKAERDPYLVETTSPGVFAVGDIRAGLVKRVASGVGEGSIAIAFVHQHLSRSSPSAPQRASGFLATTARRSSCEPLKSN